VSNHLILAPPGQQMGHEPDPRYLCPRLQVFQPLLVFVGADFFFVAMTNPLLLKMILY